MAQALPLLSAADHERVSRAVAAAEAHTSGEIVTIVTPRSDGYSDVALAWAALVAFTAITAMSLFPAFYLGLIERVTGSWGQDWSAGGLLGLAASVGILKFLSMLALQMWPPLKFALVPPGVKSLRVRDRALICFRVGAERRTRGRTGVLIYLSLAEHRAEIIADETIAARVDPEVWGDAMAAMLPPIREGRLADGMIAAVERVGRILAEHLPREERDTNELPDRLIEV